MKHTKNIIITAVLLIAVLGYSVIHFSIGTNSIKNNTASVSAIKSSTIENNVNFSSSNDSSVSDDYYSRILTSTEADEHMVSSYSTMTKTFFYETKPSYSSREEILQEKYNLNVCYKAYQEHKSQDIQNQTLQIFSEIDNHLNKLLEQFPPLEDEMKRKKANHFYSFYDITEDMFYRAELKYKENPKSSYHLQEYTQLSEEFEIYKKKKTDYESGKITIDEAGKCIGLTFDSNGDYKYDPVSK